MATKLPWSCSADSNVCELSPPPQAYSAPAVVRKNVYGDGRWYIVSLGGVWTLDSWPTQAKALAAAKKIVRIRGDGQVEPASALPKISPSHLAKEYQANEDAHAARRVDWELYTQKKKYLLGRAENRGSVYKKAFDKAIAPQPKKPTKSRLQSREDAATRAEYADEFREEATWKRQQQDKAVRMFPQLPKAAAKRFYQVVGGPGSLNDVTAARVISELPASLQNTAEQALIDAGYRVSQHLKYRGGGSSAGLVFEPKPSPKAAKSKSKRRAKSKYWAVFEFTDHKGLEGQIISTWEDTKAAAEKIARQQIKAGTNLGIAVVYGTPEDYRVAKILKKKPDETVWIVEVPGDSYDMVGGALKEHQATIRELVLGSHSRAMLSKTKESAYYEPDAKLPIPVYLAVENWDKMRNGNPTLKTAKGAAAIKKLLAEEKLPPPPWP